MIFHTVRQRQEKLANEMPLTLSDAPEESQTTFIFGQLCSINKLFFTNISH
jgi:hypothetical protein